MKTSGWKCGGVLPLLKRQTRKLILDPSLTAKTRLLFLTGYSPGLLLATVLDITPWEPCLHNGADPAVLYAGSVDAPGHVLCACEALATLRHTCLCSFSMDPENVRNLNLRAVWNFIKGPGLPRFGHQFKGEQRACHKVVRELGRRGCNPFTVLLYCIHEETNLSTSGTLTFYTYWRQLYQLLKWLLGRVFMAEGLVSKSSFYLHNLRQTI